MNWVVLAFVAGAACGPATYRLLARGEDFATHLPDQRNRWIRLVAVFGLSCATFGVLPVLGTYLPVMVIASWIGNWLFYVQHQFDRTHWERDRDWDFHVASLSGSSYFMLPPILQWFSGNIGLHHVHHLCSRVPNYRLQACLNAAPELEGIAKQITLRQSLGCWRLALWDERRHLLVGFRDLKPRGRLGDTSVNECTCR